MIAAVLDVLGVAVLFIGLALITVALYALLRRPDVFGQLHAAGLVTGPAVILVLIASIATASTEVITSAVLVILFVLVTSPLSSHAIAQAAHRGPRRAGQQRGDRVDPS